MANKITQTLNILIVEDEPPIALIGRKAVEGAGHTAKVAENGAVALEILAKGGIDIVLLNYQLPDISGGDLLRNVVEQYPNVPVIMITGHGHERLVTEIMKAGAKDYLVKDHELSYLKALPKTIEQVYLNSKLEEKTRQLLQQLVLSNEQLELALSGGNIGLWDWNVLTGEMFVDKHWAEIQGYRVDEIEPHISSIQKMVHPDDIALVEKGMEDLIEDRTDILNNEFRMKNKSGEWRWVSVHCKVTKRDGNGKAMHVSGTHCDITERKKMEEALLQSEKLRSIGTITVGISHEFNNLLAIISGNVQLLEETYKDHEELTDALRTIKRATNDGAEISKRMLEFTQAKKDTAVFMSSDINELIKQAIDFTIPRWKNMAQARGIDYHMDTEGMKNIYSILCNPIEIREVFTNIINNALDAMPDGGRLSFRTWSKDDTVFVSITDNGKGMTEDVKKNIFDPFFTTRRPERTGLGMSTSYSIMVRHSGKIEVESEVNKGTTFTLSFPITIETVQRTVSTEPTREKEAKGLRILVIDDEKDICNILDKFLSIGNHKVKTVDNGADAINIIKAEDLDLVLCDLAMPNVNGYDVVKILNSLEKRPKIGIMTGWNEMLKPIDDEDFKVDFIIKKPFDLSELSGHINDLGIED